MMQPIQFELGVILMGAQSRNSGHINRISCDAHLARQKVWREYVRSRDHSVHSTEPQLSQPPVIMTAVPKK